MLSGALRQHTNKHTLAEHQLLFLFNLFLFTSSCARNMLLVILHQEV